jgi:acyl-coenzyme A thioesterase PaaI-like protein
VRYRDPVGVGDLIRVEARLKKRRDPLVILEGKAVRADDGKTVAECEASFMVVGPLEK